MIAQQRRPPYYPREAGDSSFTNYGFPGSPAFTAFVPPAAHKIAL